MNKEEFLNLLNNAKEDEYGNLYYIDTHLDINNRVYFGTITTICEDLIEVFASKEKEGYELYDRHFWNDDTLECKIVHTKGNDYEKAIKQLQQENQELKKQIEADYTSVYLKACEDTKDKYKTQQKEFIKYLEDGIKEAKDDRKSEWDYEIKFEINGYIDAYEEILLKYKEIVGDISE